MKVNLPFNSDAFIDSPSLWDLQPKAGEVFNMDTGTQTGAY